MALPLNTTIDQCPAQLGTRIARDIRREIRSTLNPEVSMATKVRINLCNLQELLELPGLSSPQAEAIVKFRAQHGPIKDAKQLAAILSAWPVPEALLDNADFSPAESTAPEAPGA